jgi:predicted P-loop ATPase
VPAFDADQLRRDNPLSEYLPTRGIGLSPDGAEFRACCPFHAERTPSFTVYQGRKRTQEFHCFGCGEKGDVIDFVQRYDGVPFAEACEILGGTRTTDPARVPASTSIERVDIYAAWKARMPDASTPPIEAGKRTPPLANPKRPEKPVTHYTPTAVYPYHHSDGRVIGYVLRVEIKGKKLTPLVLWCENTETGELTWCHRPFAAPRRLYNLPAFAARPDAQVLVVEGEKCAEAGKRILPKAVVTTWQGGGKAAGKSDWSPVRGRDVLIWPDADPEGLDAAHEAASLAKAAGASRVRIIAPPADKPKGWDIADAEAEGWTRADVVAFARAEAREAGQTHRTPDPEPQPPEDERQRFDEPTPERGGERHGGPATRPALKPVEQEKPQPEPESKPRPRLRLVDNETAARMSDGMDWEAYLEKDAHDRNKPKSFTNFVVMMQREPSMRGVFMFNEFSNQVLIAKKPAWVKSPGDWKPRRFEDDDASQARMYLEKRGFNATNSDMHAAINRAARALTINPVRDWMNGLKWDGKERLFGNAETGGWLSTYLGAKPTKSGIDRAFGGRWLIGAVARNLTENEDGEKMDNMLVLEGPQAMYKSTSLKVLATVAGGVYFIDGIHDFSSKDAILNMQGNLIIEADEMVAVKRGDADVTKGMLSRTTDKIRPPYGRETVNLPRRFVIAGTLNPQGRGYLKDPTGARRFWPVLIERPADLAALERDREKLWAEAVAHYLGGEPWWLQGEEVQQAEAEQRKRYQADPWAGRIDEFLDTLTSDTETVTVSQIFSILSIPSVRQDPQFSDRIISHLLMCGWTRTSRTKAGKRTDAFKRPA